MVWFTLLPTMWNLKPPKNCPSHLYSSVLFSFPMLWSYLHLFPSQQSAIFPLKLHRTQMLPASLKKQTWMILSHMEVTMSSAYATICVSLYIMIPFWSIFSTAIMLCRYVEQYGGKSTALSKAFLYLKLSACLSLCLNEPFWMFHQQCLDLLV